MLRRGRIRARNDNAVIAIMRTRRPDFLSVDYPVIAVAFGLGTQARNVRTGGWLGKQLAPDFFAIKRRLHKAFILLLRGPRHHGRNAHAQPDIEKPAGYFEIRFFLRINDRLY